MRIARVPDDNTLVSTIMTEQILYGPAMSIIHAASVYPYRIIEYNTSPALVASLRAIRLLKKVHTPLSTGGDNMVPDLLVSQPTCQAPLDINPLEFR